MYLLVGVGHAYDINENFKLDGYFKVGYALEDSDIKRLDADTKRFQADVNTDYMYEGEAGLTINDLVRVYGLKEGIENIVDTVGFGSEVNIFKGIGSFVEYNWIYSDLTEDGNKVIWGGLIFRLP